MIWITRDREFIDDSQQQNRKDFVIGLQKWAGQPKLQTLATHNQMQNSSSGSFTMLAMNH